MSVRRVRLMLLTAAVAAGCASQPAVPPHHDSKATAPAYAANAVGEQVADVAVSMVGTPYRFGGSDPDGFDCSGLVYFAYRRAGVEVPRTSRAQRRAAHTIPVRSARVGDVLFFDTSWKDGHVGIYVGDGRFVHAPSSGKTVSVERLDSGYSVHRIEAAGRLVD